MVARHVECCALRCYIHNAGIDTRGAARQQQQQQGQVPATLPTPPAQQQQQQGPVPAPGGPNTESCRGVLQRGPKKGTLCGKREGGRVAGLCTHHDGNQQRRRTPAEPRGAAEGVAAQRGGGAGGADESKFGSDEELG